MSHYYGGHVPICVTEASLNYEPGVSREIRNTRLHLPSFTPTLQLASEARQSVSLDASAHLTKDIYAPKAEKEITVHTLPIPKPAPKLSTSSSAFVNFSDEADAIARLVDAHDVLTAAFQSVDTEATGFIRPTELRMVLRAALGGEEPTRQHLRVFTLFLGGGRDRVITLDEFIATVPKAAEYMYKEIQSMYPSVVKASVASANAHRAAQEDARRTGLLPAGSGATSPSTAAGGGGASVSPTHGEEATKKVEGFRLSGPVPRSTYQLDVGDDKGASARPVHDPTGRGMFTTTRDLAMGTPKVTQTLANYGGHIPQYAPLKDAPCALRVDTRDNTKINLGETFHRRVPGYSGFLPANGGANGFEIRKVEGAGAATDYARASYAVASLWGSRLGDPGAFISSKK